MYPEEAILQSQITRILRGGPAAPGSARRMRGGEAYAPGAFDRPEVAATEPRGGVQSVRSNAFAQGSAAVRPGSRLARLSRGDGRAASVVEQ
jgi:hypothetical protein